MRTFDYGFPKAFGHLVRQRHWRLLIVLMLMLALVVSSSMASAEETGYRHKYLMRGQVLEVENQTLVLCIGTADGAEVGQELDVVRHVKSQIPPKATGPNFQRQKVGKVRITTIFDEHYAEATVLDGDVRLNDTVETAAH
jgi:hypothetical protein